MLCVLLFYLLLLQHFGLHLPSWCWSLIILQLLLKLPGLFILNYLKNLFNSPLIGLAFPELPPRRPPRIFSLPPTFEEIRSTTKGTAIPEIAFALEASNPLVNKLSITFFVRVETKEFEEAEFLLPENIFNSVPNPFLDVSSVKILAALWNPEVSKGYKKKSTHQALQDIRDSIEELSYYRQHFFNL